MTNIIRNTSNIDERKDEKKFMEEFNKTSKKLGLKYRCSMHHKQFPHIYGGINPFWFNFFSSNQVVLCEHTVSILDIFEKRANQIEPILKKLKQYDFILRLK